MGPKTGAVSGDFCGILIPLTLDVHEVTAEFIKLGEGTAYRHEPVKMADMIPIWEFKR